MKVIDFSNDKVPKGLGDFIINLVSAKENPDTLVIIPECMARFAPLLEGLCYVRIQREGERKIPMLTQRDMDDASFVRDPSICLKRYCSPYWAYLRQIEHQRWVPLVERLLNEGWQVLDFGTSDVFVPLPISHPNYLHQVDLPLRAVAARLKKSGRYLGVDTGEMHLAYEQGVTGWVVRPPECSDYLYSDWSRPGLNYFQTDNDISLIYDSINSSRG